MMKSKIALSALLFLSVLLLNGCYGEYLAPGINDYNYTMSGGYQLFKNGAQDTSMTISICDGSGQEVIGNRIVGIAWDKKFILASQNDCDTTNYWIISVGAKTIIGPLSKSEFNDKRKDLNIDSKLTLQDPAKYKDFDPSASMQK